jgi:hypothetical protein
MALYSQNPPIRNGIMNQVRVIPIWTECSIADAPNSRTNMIAAAMEGS